MHPYPRHPRPVILWLCLCALLVASMVLVGGYTRLSGSGLSITEWKPIHGVVPPIGDAEWTEEFDAYRATPQYAKVNAGMSLGEFKTIFWPEFFHRLLGRLVGMVFFIPFLFFWQRGYFSRAMLLRLAGIFALGGLQGFIGWYMVKSGLVNDPYVSHLRLALHLGVAFAIFGLLVWTILGMRQEAGGRSVSPHAPCLMPHAYFIWFALLCLQIILGAFVAGLHAGLVYNTYPTMNGDWIPPDLLATQPWWHNLVLIQFLHRHLAFFVAVGFVIWWRASRGYVRDNHLGKACVWVTLAIAFQFALGVMTLLHMAPLSLALAHQMTALALFTLAVMLMHGLAKTKDGN